jgi:hypothetical protein
MERPHNFGTEIGRKRNGERDHGLCASCPDLPENFWKCYVCPACEGGEA